MNRDISVGLIEYCEIRFDLCEILWINTFQIAYRKLYAYIINIELNLNDISIF